MNNQHEQISLKARELSTLPLTGERTIPGIPEENYWFRRHEIAYEYLKPYALNKKILEAGAGEGYGANTLAQQAHSVLAIDYDVSVIEHITNNYPSVTTQIANLYELNTITSQYGLFDIIVNFQVIEHLWEQEKFLRDAATALAPKGMLFLTTPNRLTFSPGMDTPLNPFHTRELSAQELSDMLLKNGFKDITMLGIHHGPKFISLKEHLGESIIDAQIAAVVSGQGYSPELLAAISSITSADFLIHPNNIDACLDLFAIAVKK